MNFNEIKELIQLFDSSSIHKLEIQNQDTHIKLNKSSGTSPAANIGSHATAFVDSALLPSANVGYTSADLTQVTFSSSPMAEVTQSKNEKLVKAPLVGTFYAAPAPEKPPFAKVGDTVKVGDVLCIIEAMKVLNEIKSEFEGKIAEILIENEQLAEYGQVLFKII